MPATYTGRWPFFVGWPRIVGIVSGICFCTNPIQTAPLERPISISEYRTVTRRDEGSNIGGDNGLDAALVSQADLDDAVCWHCVEFAYT